MSENHFDPTDPKNRARAIERAKEHAAEYRKHSEEPGWPRGVYAEFRADAEMLECLLSVAEEHSVRRNNPYSWHFATLRATGERFIARPGGVEWIVRRLNDCRASSDPEDECSFETADLEIGEPVDVVETQDEEGAYGLVWTADDHEEAANSLTSSASAKDAHRRAASVGRTEKGSFVVRWAEAYLAPEYVGGGGQYVPVAHSPETAARFATEEAALNARAKCNNGWRKHAVIEPVFDRPARRPDVTSM